jgi:hypothetical protein
VERRGEVVVMHVIHYRASLHHYYLVSVPSEMWLERVGREPHGPCGPCSQFCVSGSRPITRVVDDHLWSPGKARLVN